MPYSRRIPEAAWEGQREFVLSKYLGDNLSLKEVRDELALRRGFEVTLSQLEYRCKTKWSLDKYLNKASWQRIASLHAPDGRGERQFFIRGMHIPPRKVAKEIKRHGFLHKESLPRTLVTGPATGTGTSATGLPLDLPGLRSCPVASDSDLPVVKKGTVSAEEQGYLVALASLGPSERSELLSKIINKLIDNFKSSLDDNELLMHGVASVISISRVTSKELGALATLSVAFHATVLRTWGILFKDDHWIPRNRHCIDKDEIFHRIITWLLAASVNRSILRPSIDKAFDLALMWGYDKTALLLEPLKNFSHGPGFWLQCQGIQEMVRLRTESSLLLARRIVLNGFPEWRRFMLGNFARYSRTDDLKKLLALASAIFKLGRGSNDTYFWSHTVIRDILIDCIQSETEESAAEKLDIFLNVFDKMGLVLNETHIDSDVLIAAAQRGYLRVLANVLTINQDLRITDERGFTALHAAADFGHLEMCKWILQKGPGFQQDVDGLLSALLVALAQGHFEIVQLFDAQLSIIHRRQLSAAEWRVRLCNCTASYEERYSFGTLFEFCKRKLKLGTFRSLCILCKAAVAASIEGLTSHLQFYLDHGATVSLHPTLSATICPADVERCHIPHHLTLRSRQYWMKKGRMQYRAIIIGSLSARMKCVALLLSSGITPTARDKITSLRAGEWEMTQLLDCYGVPIQHDQSRFEAAICGRDQQCITETYKSGNSGCDSGALCAAVAFAEDSRFIRELALEIIAQRAARDLGSTVESTAIAMAALSDDTELFMRLISAIPSPHPSCTISNDMRITSWRAGILDKVRDAILKHSFRGEAHFWHNESRQSLLGVVAMCGRPEMLQALLDRGVQRDLAACSRAVEAGCRRSLELLLRGQPPLRTWARSHKDDEDPLVAAIMRWDHSRGDFSQISQILSAGADINAATEQTVLCHAVWSKNPRLVEFLIQNGADVNARSSDPSSPTALHRALEFGGADVVQLLLDLGADVNAPATENSDTCLQMAALRFDFLEMLLDKKVKVGGVHRLDFIIAVFRSQPLIARRLRQYGSWQDEDEDILEIMKSLPNHQRGRRLDIRVGVSRVLAKREQVKIQEPETSDTAGNMTNADGPRSLGVLSPYHPLSEWQFDPGYFRATAIFTEFHDGSYPLMDMSTPPYSWGGMEICDQEYGSNLMRQRIRDVGAEEEDEIVWLD